MTITSITVTSDTRPGVRHTVSVDDWGRPRCTCESFQWSKAKPATCKHIQRLAAVEEVES